MKGLCFFAVMKEGKGKTEARREAWREEEGKCDSIFLGSGEAITYFGKKFKLILHPSFYDIVK